MIAAARVHTAARERIVVMGVAGSGKTSVGERCRRRTTAIRSATPTSSTRPPTSPRCRPGIPLDDADRWPWLDAIGAAIHDAGRRA